MGRQNKIFLPFMWIDVFKKVRGKASHIITRYFSKDFMYFFLNKRTEKCIRHSYIYMLLAYYYASFINVGNLIILKYSPISC